MYNNIGRRPLAKDSQLDYEVDSDEEWGNEPEDGEDLSSDVSSRWVAKKWYALTHNQKTKSCVIQGEDDFDETEAGSVLRSDGLVDDG